MKDLFVIELGVEAMFSALKASSPAAAPFIGFIQPIVAYIAKAFLGFLVERGIYVIDLGTDAIKVGLQKPEFKEKIEKLYKKATARVYSEAEKNEIRKAYLDTLRKFGHVADERV